MVGLWPSKIRGTGGAGALQARTVEPSPRGSGRLQRPLSLVGDMNRLLTTSARKVYCNLKSVNGALLPLCIAPL